MDKEKKNLEQLYHERFQSFEMEQTPDINLRMKQKLRYTKTMKLIKWIALGLLATTVAVIIGLWSMDFDEASIQIQIPENKSAIGNAEDKSDLDTPLTISTQKTNKNQIGQRDSQKSSTSKNSDAPLKEKIDHDPIENRGEIEEREIIADIVEKEYPESNIENVNNAIVVDKLEEQRPNSDLDNQFLEGRPAYLLLHNTDENLNDWQANLFPENKFNAKRKPSRSRKSDFAQGKEIKTGNSQFSALLDIHLSPLWWKNNVNMVLPELDSNWTSSLIQNAQLSYEVGIAFQLHHKGTPLFLQMGFDYQILKEKVDFQLTHTYEDLTQSYWTYDSTFDIQDVIDTFFVIIDSNQFVIDTIFTQDTLLTGIDSAYNSIVSSEEKRKKHINTYTYLNIPLLLGYQFQSKNERWSFQLLAGASLAINLSNEGFYYDNNGGFESFSGKVKPSFVWNLQAAANINYHWKKWQFFIQPEIQYQLNESEIYNQPPRRKYQFYKLKAGIRYHLF